MRKADKLYPLLDSRCKTLLPLQFHSVVRLWVHNTDYAHPHLNPFADLLFFGRLLQMGSRTLFRKHLYCKKNI